MKKKWEIEIDDESKVNVTIIRSPEGYRFSMVYLLLFLDRWVDIARIDNYAHEGRQGAHIHRLGEERVEFREMDFKEAERTLMNIGKGIKERMKDGAH